MPPPKFHYNVGNVVELSPHILSLIPHEAIRAKREELPWLGDPVSDAAVTANGQGWYRHFQNGSVFWSSETGAHEVHGAIRDKWAGLGWEASFLGFPVTDETATPDSVGRFNHFQGGSIYWSPTTGAWEIHGAIRNKWAELGWERSFLGYPISDEESVPDGGGRFSNFEHGQIAWSAMAGAAVSATDYQPAPASGGLHPLGIGPSGTPEVRRRAVVAAHMDLTDDETFGSNEHSTADLRNEAIVTNSMPQELIRMSDGAGGELRVELRLDAAALLEGDVLVTGQALLYEGTSEQSDDLDGDEPIKFIAPRDNFTSKTYTVTNEDEGGDFGVITMSVSNFPV